MKRTSEFLSSIMPSPVHTGGRALPENGGPTSYSDFMLPGNKRRILAQTSQGPRLLLSPDEWSAGEFLATLQVPEELRGPMHAQVAQLHEALIDPRISSADRDKLAGVLCEAVTDAVRALARLRADQQEPAAPALDDLPAEPQDDDGESTGSGKGLVALQKQELAAIRKQLDASNKCARALVLAHEAKARVKRTVAACQETLNKAVLVAATVANRAREHEEAQAREVDALPARLSEINLAIAEHIRENSLQRVSGITSDNVISLCVGAITEPDAVMNTLLADHAQARRAAAVAEESLAAATAEAQLHKRILDHMRAVFAVMRDAARACTAEAAAHRTHVARCSVEAVRKLTPALARGLARFLNLHLQRARALRKKAADQQAEMDEHASVCGDDAPHELAAVRRRLEETQAMRDRAREELARVAADVERVWLHALVPLATAARAWDAATHPSSEAGKEATQEFVKSAAPRASDATRIVSLLNEDEEESKEHKHDDDDDDVEFALAASYALRPSEAAVLPAPLVTQMRVNARGVLALLASAEEEGDDECSPVRAVLEKVVQRSLRFTSDDEDEGRSQRPPADGARAVQAPSPMASAAPASSSSSSSDNLTGSSIVMSAEVEEGDGSGSFMERLQQAQLMYNPVTDDDDGAEGGCVLM